MLRRFKDIRRCNHTLNDLIKHIHKDYCKDSKEKIVLSFGGILITSSGQHRLALAKFMGISKVKVSVHEYIFEQRKFDKYIEALELERKLILYGAIDVKDSKVTIDSYDIDYYHIFILNREYKLNITSISKIIKYYEYYLSIKVKLSVLWKISLK